MLPSLTYLIFLLFSFASTPVTDRWQESPPLTCAQMDTTPHYLCIGLMIDTNVDAALNIHFDQRSGRVALLSYPVCWKRVSKLIYQRWVIGMIILLVWERESVGVSHDGGLLLFLWSAPCFYIDNILELQ